jgi:hypothetical protein
MNDRGTRHIADWFDRPDSPLREVLELHGPWFKHPDGRFVDWSELPENEQRRLRGAEDGRMDNEHDAEAYAKAKAITDKYWPKYGEPDGKQPMCSIAGDYVRSHIEQQMALEFERLRKRPKLQAIGPDGELCVKW